MKGCQESIGSNDSAPTAHIKGLGVFLAVISYGKWNFRASGVSKAFLKSEPSDREIYAAPPLFTGKSGRAMGTFKTIIRLRNCA